MTKPPSPVVVVPPSAARPVLFWRPEPDESHVQPNIEQAARFLGVQADAVVTGIERGEMVGGWFVDWEASGGGGA